jgi:hypothetical protein
MRTVAAVVSRLVVLAVAIALVGCGGLGGDTETVTVEEVTVAFGRGGLPVHEVDEGEVLCDERPPEMGPEDGSCAVFSWSSGEGPSPAAFLLPSAPDDARAFVVLVYSGPVPPEHAAPSLSEPHYANVVAGNVLVSVYDDDVRSQVVQILDDL